MRMTCYSHRHLNTSRPEDRSVLCPTTPIFGKHASMLRDKLHFEYDLEQKRKYSEIPHMHVKHTYGNVLR
jgi:hypothetical protein